jgi:hypothetical protein
METGSFDSIIYIRSLGFTYIELLLVYCSGFFQIIKKNIYPINVILFAIFTNGGSFILNIVFILMGEFNNSGLNGKIIIYASCFYFSLLL